MSLCALYNCKVKSHNKMFTFLHVYVHAYGNNLYFLYCCDTWVCCNLYDTLTLGLKSLGPLHFCTTLLFLPCAFYICFPFYFLSKLLATAWYLSSWKMLGNCLPGALLGRYIPSSPSLLANQCQSSAKQLPEHWKEHQAKRNYVVRTWCIDPKCIFCLHRCKKLKILC